MLVTLLKPTEINPSGIGPITPLISAVRLPPSSGGDGEVSVGAAVRHPDPKLVALAESCGVQLTVRLAVAKLDTEAPLLLECVIVMDVPLGPTGTTTLWLMDVVGLKKPPSIPDKAPETVVVLYVPEEDALPLTERT